jgi:glycosyltransferase involved in cell wall biosynthesis
VPGKVLSYLCVGRPILGAIAKKNLAALTIEEARAGIVVEPDDHQGFLAGLDRLLSDAEFREQLGRNGRNYAERTFDIGHIASRFEAVFVEAIERHRGAGHPAS